MTERSIEAYLPIFKTVRQWSDRKKTILKPLFPSYVFVHIVSSIDFYRALSINGACKYIRFGNEYAQITEKEINKIKLLTGDKNIKDIETSTTSLQVGNVRKILYGPLSGLECEVLKINKVKKIIVRINSLSQNIIATLPFYYLEEIFSIVNSGIL